MLGRAFARSALQRARRFDGIVYASDAMCSVVEFVPKYARSEKCVLILGETGSGKDRVARALHDASPRAEGAFEALNCGAVPEGLIESELFGHEAGAFTGATHERPGKFERADGGTLFLDEVGETAAAMQAKLLRVLEQGEIERVGGVRAQKVDVRIVVATHRHLQTEVQRGTFREDLYYRLNVLPMRIPHLRERRDDIPPLLAAFLPRAWRSDDDEKLVMRFDDEAWRALLSFPWPGNVRQLRNVADRLAVHFPDRGIAGRDVCSLLDEAAPSVQRLVRQKPGPRPRPFDRQRAEELRSRGWTLSEIAADLCISRATLCRRWSDCTRDGLKTLVDPETQNRGK